MLTDKTRRGLIKAAKDARKMAYAPYSKYKVGAALLTVNGEVITGCNVENASFGGTICAERTAVVKAISQGAAEFVAMAVVTKNGGFPCGLCRQFMNEFAPELIIITADTKGKIRNEAALSEILPHGFGPKELHAAS